MKPDSAVEKFICSMDVYGEPVRMQYKLSTTFQTIFGGLISLAIYVIFVCLFCYLYADLQEKNNYSLTSLNQVYADPPEMQLTADFSLLNFEEFTSRGFFFHAFKITNKATGQVYTKEQLDRLFYMEAFDNFRNKTTGVTTVLNQYELFPCTTVYSQINFTDMFQDNLLDNTLCSNSTVNTVKGDFVSDYRFVSFKLKECSTSVLASRPKCANATEIADAKKNLNVLFIYSEYKLVPNLVATVPIKYFINFINVGVSSWVYQKFDCYLGQNFLQSYDDIYNQFSYLYTQPVIGMNKIVKHDSNPSKTMMAFYLRSDYRYVTYVRNFKTLLDLIGQLGGIWRVVFTLGGLIAVPINAKLLNIAIANDLFNLFPPEKKKDLEKETYVELQKKSTIDDPNQLIVANNKNPLETKIAIDYYKYERNKGMNYTIKETIYSVFLFFCKTEAIKNKEKIFDEAGRRLCERLNVSDILKFSLQFNMMRRALLGEKNLLIGLAYKNNIYYAEVKPIHEERTSRVNGECALNVDYGKQYNPLDKIRTYCADHHKLQDSSPTERALRKEQYLIEGIRAMKNKIGGMNETIDVNLLEMFNFRKKYLARYFLPQIDILEIRYKDIREYLKTDKEDHVEDLRMLK